MSTEDFMKLLTNTIIVAVVGFLILQGLSMYKAYLNNKLQRDYVLKEDLHKLNKGLEKLHTNLVEIRESLDKEANK